MDTLFPLNTATVVISGACLAAATAVRHYTKHKEVTSASAARSSLLFDEAFSVVKGFFEKASLHTIEDLQTFGNNFVPSPFWVRVIRVVVPLATTLEAGKILQETLGEQEVIEVLGGKEWWQRTAHKTGGVDGEWISMKRDWQGLDAEGDDNEQLERLREEKLKGMKDDAKQEKRRRWRMGKQKEGSAESSPGGSGATTPQEPKLAEEESYSSDMDEMRCILYIHGGAYFFGSINTHRYSIWRYARKVGGRAFSVNYRLAPQYPFPCALADALASYLYLIRPPPEAKHKPVDPAKLTLAGDSAGGGLCLALLCLIRDAGLPLPAGAALLSPWCDLSHSFPSILENTKTDIIPPYGFLFKPSTLWPPPPPEFQERAERSTSIDGLKQRAAEITKERANKHRGGLHPHHRTSKKGRELAKDVQNLPDDDPQQAEGTTKDPGHEQAKGEVGKVLKVKVDGEEVEVVDQIQLYATNEQLVYPFVSPIWQPSLGGLPPLYIMCGDKEVLRDEIVYMAHRAANPAKYPIRKALLDANPERTRKHAQYPPTKVHLQIYDGVCHDLPLFSFTVPAKYCYRAVASFIKWVTADAREGGSREGSVVPPSPVSATTMEMPVEVDASHVDVARHHEAVAGLDAGSAQETPILGAPVSEPPAASASSSPLAPPVTTDLLTPPSAGVKSSSQSPSLESAPQATSSRHGRHIAGLEKTIYTSTQPFNRPDFVDGMIRERIGVTGVVRPLEPQEEMSIFKLDPEDLGLVKEAPVKRYLAGKAIWDKRFKSTYEKVQKKREHHLQKSMKEEAERITKRLKEAASKKEPPSVLDPSKLDEPPRQTDSPEPLDPESSVHGIWDLKGEKPPPSSIAARKDTLEARKLASFLDEHYSKLNALSVLSEITQIANRAAPPRHQASEEVEPAGPKEALKRVISRKPA